MKGSFAGDTGALYSLISLNDFKAVLGVDDREESLCRYCLITATYTIEYYCKRRLLKKIHTEYLDFTGDCLLPLREYPVREIISISNEQLAMSNGGIIEPEFYRVIPDPEEESEELPLVEDVPYYLVLRPFPRLLRGEKCVKVKYRAGYGPGRIPPDLACACLELAAWNMTRYRGRRIGMTGNVRGSGKDGECLEVSMPENVRLLLEPYRRKVI